MFAGTAFKQALQMGKHRDNPAGCNEAGNAEGHAARRIIFGRGWQSMRKAACAGKVVADHCLKRTRPKAI
jgi:hypothetical protein